MPVLVSRASLTLYLEEDGLASVGEGDTDTPTVVGVAAGVVGSAGAGLPPTGTPGTNVNESS